MRGLTSLADPTGSGNRLHAVLDRRLRAGVDAPLAVAFSGGGDSLALLLAARTWAQANDRRLLVLTVDHGLNPDSARWLAWCQDRAARLGLAFTALRWTGDKPATGLPAAARAARHALLADAARAAGASVILMGHTADDLAEAAAMRAEGSTVPDPVEWAPSPAWPQGRGVFLLRPMLGLRRADIRDRLRALGETWIDDPANDDPRFARSRARSSIARDEVAGSSPGTSDRSEAEMAPFTARPLASPHGGLTLPVCAPARLVAIACLCAAGTRKPPRSERLERLVGRLRSGEAFSATLAGARVASDGETALFVRNAGEMGRRGAPREQRFCKPKAAVWDGRFEITADHDVVIAPLAGHAARLPKDQRAALAAIPAMARPSLPVILAGNGTATCPILAEDPSVRVRALALPRFEAAGGFVDMEPAV